MPILATFEDGVLNVSTDIKVPSSGYEASLAGTVQEGKTLRINVALQKPSPRDVVLPAFRRIPFTFSGQLTDHDLAEVEIVVDGASAGRAKITCKE